MSDFSEAVAHYCDGLHVSVGASAICTECLDTYGIKDRDARGRFRSVQDMQAELYAIDEPSFSWMWCDSCGSSFGGDRHTAHGIATRHPDRAEVDILHLSICTDCAMLHENGDEPEEWRAHP